MDKNLLKRILIILGIPILYAVFLRLLFGVDTWRDLYSVMSVSFLFCLPTIVGALTVYFSSVDKVQKFAYRFFVPWLPILIFLVLTLALAWEGWACWTMALPLFLLAASIGGLIGGYLKLRKKDNIVYVSVLTLFPLLIAPVERMVGAIPGTYEAYTYIDIKSTADKIWDNVTQVKEIPVQQDKGWLTRSLGFPRPVKAELNFLGVGAYRKAIFTNGLIFHETVTEYIDKKKMVFTIKAYPHEIPSTTMDEHVVIGGNYFDVLNGTYELEKLSYKKYRLHLYSHFKLTTTFNFYASWWAKWIMKDIQNNILHVEKQRAETE
ncbi:hypothetical protein [Flavihumibacter profundi]|uniref:hypothetical protein n=1 Tax=Flavihumibacter profundi TaxID=2716883 RepID=UPI001CC45A7A|nr:hypothetical protein [Flavihumibacter profundi]MBZ5857399.1 hypothetical protein [Flavihumibacter profundi]